MAYLVDQNGDPITSTNRLPVDAQLTGSKQQQIQTHNAVSVLTTAWSNQTVWMDCAGYDQIAVTLANDAATASIVNVQWSHDGVNQHGEETPLVSGTPRYRSATLPTKARYAKVAINNADAATHTMSAWAYLKA